MVNPLTDEIIALKREAVESLYTGIMKVYEYPKIKNPKTGIEKPLEYFKYSDVPCRISSQGGGTTNKTDKKPVISKGISVICPPEYEIKAGSRLEITFNGETNRYKLAGEKKLYSDHQTIEIELEKENP